MFQRGFNMQEPNPGDFGCVKLRGVVGPLITAGQVLNGSFRKEEEHYDHALIYIGNGVAFEARPGGADYVTLANTDYGEILWSTGTFTPTLTQQEQILRWCQHYKGTPYSALDYFALSAHRLHIPAPGLRGYIEADGHLICSQLVDRVWNKSGIHLFANRWDGYVVPADLAGLLLK
jgi:uncharacterized protein YycO